MTSRVETIGRLRNRVTAVAERAVAEFSEADQSTEDDEHRVTVLVQVHCDQCNTQYPITEFLRNGGCNCRSVDD
ncbi:rod-determining factor RdfA [Salinigranum rubrum]|uniref:rod-determining factor RdfA n=1 Tax=Salinigranum rubrum TaxID=755307 RepID=UPI0037430B49